MPPDKLGRYEILRELGHGAMGVVYEATDPTIGRRVALKAIRFDGIGTTADEAAKRFKNEARAAGGLNHPNLVTVYDAGEDGGNLYLAMEFIEGSNLDELLRAQHTLPPQKAIDIIRQVCSGLDFAHSKGIVHRDIKPANVMLGPHGVVKITDFGIARAGEAMTLTGQVIGTPHYMSPEQVVGKTLDGRSDLFSVGVMLYEMITGERPFEGQSITTIMYKIVHETPVSPRKLDSTIHPGLSAVIEKALAKAPEERFQTGADLTKALENYERSPIAQSSTLDLPTHQFPVAVGEPAQPSSDGTQVIQPAASSTTDPAISGRRFFSRLSPAARKRLIVFGVLWVLFLANRYREHGTQNRSQDIRSETRASVAAPAPPQANESTEDNGEEVKAGQQPLTEHPNATENKSTALLKVNSSPPAAIIEIDGKSTGQTTPAELQLPRGQHSVTVRMAGFTPSSASFRVKGGEEIEYSPELSVSLPNIPGAPNVAIPDLSGIKDMVKQQTLQGKAWERWAREQNSDQPKLVITSSPLGARVLINGNDSGKTTPAVIATKPGEYQIRLELDGFEPAEKDVKVQERKPGVWNPSLKRVKGQD